jgi:hypothetical protein
MTHHESLLVDAYLDGEMSSADALAMERHLDICAECRRQLEVGLALRNSLAESAFVPDLQSSGQLWAAIEPQLVSRSHALGVAGWASGALLAVVALVAQTALAVLLIFATGGALGFPASEWLTPLGDALPDMGTAFLPVPPVADEFGYAYDALLVGASSFTMWLLMMTLALSFFGWVLAARRRHQLAGGLPVSLQHRAGAHN